MMVMVMEAEKLLKLIFDCSIPSPMGIARPEKLDIGSLAELSYIKRSWSNLSVSIEYLDNLYHLLEVRRNKIFLNLYVRCKNRSSLTRL